MPEDTSQKVMWQFKVDTASCLPSGLKATARAVIVFWVRGRGV